MIRRLRNVTTKNEQGETVRFVSLHQGQYPVIYINFKELGTNSLDEFMEDMKIMMMEVCHGCCEQILSSNRVKQGLKEWITTISKGVSSYAIFQKKSFL